MASDATLRVLIADDSAADARLLQYELRQVGFEPVVTRVESEEDYLSALRKTPDVILCDYNLPQLDALRALELVREYDPELPFLIVSGSIGESVALQAMKRGATDYFLKDRLGRLGQAVKQAIEQRKLREVKRQTQDALWNSEEQYRALAESLPQIVWVAGRDGGLEYLNQRASSYCGLQVHDLLGWDWGRIVHPEDLPHATQRWSAALRTGIPHEFEFRLRRADGEYRWYLARQVAVYDSEHRIARWIGTCTDVHDQKLVTDRLARDGLLLASVRDAIVVTNDDGVVLYWNEGATRLFGWTAAEMVGRPYADRFPERLQAECVRYMRPQSVGHEWHGEYEDYRKDGTRVWIHARVGMIPDPSGRRPGILGMFYDLTERRRAETELQLRDRAIQAVSQGILITDPNQAGGPIVFANPAVERLTGYSLGELLGRSPQMLLGKDTDASAIAIIREAVANRQACAVELLNYRKNGTTFWNALTMAPVWDSGRLTHLIWVQTDVTERRMLEEQYRQAQKMEAFGQLAGGVAHDFNNLLTVINGETELLMSELPLGSYVQASLMAILEAGQKAAGLTAQLLAFTRKTIVKPKVLDLNEVVDQIGRILRRLLGEDIALITVLAPGLHRVHVDPGQIEQVVMNLAVNARDAMPMGGQLTVETRNITLRSQDIPSDADIEPGEWVQLSVSDTGCGMSDEVKAKIFEPFFTTKEVGKGTGLGLATVYGIAKTYRGHVSVVSSVGKGTRVTVWLPAFTDITVTHAVSVLAPPARGTETVLLVEDEQAVRKLVRTALESQGYQVLEASCGEDALALAQHHHGVIHLLMTDVVMPGMGGHTLAQQLQAARSELQVLFVSGYMQDAVARHGVVESKSAFLQKPFTPIALARKVREVLDRAR